jgi:hypothetical protein
MVTCKRPVTLNNAYLLEKPAPPYETRLLFLLLWSWLLTPCTTTVSHNEKNFFEKLSIHRLPTLVTTVKSAFYPNRKQEHLPTKQLSK